MNPPDFSNIPRLINIEHPPKGAELLEYETKNFGNLGQYVYLHEPNLKHVEAIYRLTDAYYAQRDIGTEESMEDKVDPCVSVFGWHTHECSNLPERIYVHLCIELSSLSKPFDTDLYAAHFAGYFSYYHYQSEGEEMNNTIEHCDQWLKDLYGAVQYHGDTKAAVANSLPAYRFDDPQCKAITVAVDRIREAERVMVSDIGPVMSDYPYPENGLFYFPRYKNLYLDNENQTYLIEVFKTEALEKKTEAARTRSGIDPDKLQAAVEAAYESENRDEALIHMCNGADQLNKTMRYIKAVDQLIELLCQIESKAQ